MQGAGGRFKWHISSELLLWLACLFWALALNQGFLGPAIASRETGLAASLGFGAALVLMLTALHYLLLAPLAHHRIIKPLLLLFTLAAAASVHFMQSYGVVMDPTMLRNVMQTHPAEARELIGPSLLLHLGLYVLLPALLLMAVRVVPQGWRRGLLRRIGGVALALVVLVGAGLAVFQPLSSLMRNNKALRYQITPASLVWSSGTVLRAELRGAAQPRQAIGLDAQPGALALARQQGQRRPLLTVLVVGETARSANWGLAGYTRQTTPELAQLGVLSWAPVQACGTNTETSLPCMFAPVGRRDYDEERIRGSESLLHVVARAGMPVFWRDNQSGCKGVCEGLPGDRVQQVVESAAAGASAGSGSISGLCDRGQCRDEGLLLGLPERLAALQKRGGTELLVLHMLGNHGPAYFRRYPPAFARFQPACQSDDLGRCSQAEIVNAYDNALLYTDHVVAQLIKQLQAAQGEVDTALLYVSDHGESLGENNLYLHGLPYALAPAVQKEVPMLMWFSSGLLVPAAGSAEQLHQTGQGSGQIGAFDSACLRQQTQKPAAHDHLFHTLLGLLDVRTGLHEPAWDLLAPCRAAASKP